MSPSLALLLSIILLWALLRYDPAKEPGISLALWIPVVWMFIVGSRLPSQWLGGAVEYSSGSFAEGNALDRNVYLFLIVLSFSVLIWRSIDWGKLFAANIALTTFVIFALLSVLWSDYPFVAFKRWFRDLGTYLAVLVALSDPRGSDAARWVLRRLFYLLIPLSILLIKYFPELAREYNSWTGQVYFVGATTSKNQLGVLCLASGLFFLWDTLSRWPDRKDGRAKWIILVNIAFLSMTMWLITSAGSATSNLCLAIGSLIIVLAQIKSIKDRPGVLLTTIPAGIGLYLLLQFGLGVDIIAAVSEAVGRDPDLTGRTHIWNVVLSADTNPFLGTGYESFWLGPRLVWVWERAGRVNHAHNGYLEVYLHLGLIGVALLACFLIASYGVICRRFKDGSSLGSLSLALWAVLLFYNFTEAAFKGQLLWIAFLLVAMTVPGRTERSTTEARLRDERAKTPMSAAAKGSKRPVRYPARKSPRPVR